ncbi:hypothetical protein [Actinokineospora terrae]|uniref:hypothetical protein n=1 Tax=Actinokineospora terrae TaxID=155974 RepID=UPI0011603375|nr:hypothetical protein [Actinokineospora terrae]
MVQTVARRAGLPAPAHTGGGSVVALDGLCRRYGITAAGVLAALEGATPDTLRSTMAAAALARTRRRQHSKSRQPRASTRQHLVTGPSLATEVDGLWADELLQQAPRLKTPAAVIAALATGVTLDRVVADAAVAARAVGEAATAGALPIPLARLRGRDRVARVAAPISGYGQAPSCPDTVTAVLAELLRENRGHAGLTVDEAVEGSRIAPDTVWQWESTQVDPPLPELLDYCAHLKTDLVTLIARVELRALGNCPAIGSWTPTTQDPCGVPGEVLTHLRRRTRLGIVRAAALHSPTLGALTLAHYEKGSLPVPTGCWILLVRRLGGCPVTATAAVLARLAHLNGLHHPASVPAGVTLPPGTRMVDLNSLATDPAPDAALLAGWANRVRADTHTCITVLDPISESTLADLLDRPTTALTAVLHRHPATPPTVLPAAWRHEPNHGTDHVTVTFGLDGEHHTIDLPRAQAQRLRAIFTPLLPVAHALPPRPPRPDEATIATALGALLTATRHHQPSPPDSPVSPKKRMDRSAAWESGSAPMTVSEFLRHCDNLGFSGAAVLAALDGTTAGQLHGAARHHRRGHRAPTLGELITQARDHANLDAQRLRALTPGPGSAIPPNEDGRTLRVTRLYLTAGVLGVSSARWLAALEPRPLTRWRDQIRVLTTLVDDLACRGVLDHRLLRADPRLPDDRIPTRPETT